MSDDLLAALEAIVGAPYLLRDEATLAPYLVDSRDRYSGQTLALVKPGTTAEVQGIVRAARAHGVAITPQGGNTGLSGGATPATAGRTVLVKLDRLNRVRDLNPIDNTITVEAGCVLADVQAAAASIGRLFPLSLGAEGSCQIGGNIATNAGGTAVLRFGPMRELVLGLEVVLPDGEVFDGLHRLRKDNTGYDLKQLFIGAEGTLGIITGAVLKLFPGPTSRAVAIVGIADVEAALNVLGRVRGALSDHLTSIEIISGNYIELIRRFGTDVAIPFENNSPFHLLIEASNTVEGFEVRAALETVLGGLLEDGVIADAVFAQNEAQAKMLWRIRHAISESVRRAGFVVAHDHAVPVDAQPAFIARSEEVLKGRFPDAEVLFAGHVGDGNIHVVALFDRDRYPTREVREPVIVAVNHAVDEVCVALGGAISAEHGIGVSVRDRLHRTTPPLEIALMRKIKQALDPDNLMNPGKIV